MTHSPCTEAHSLVPSQSAAPQGIRAWLPQYPDELDDLVLEFRFVHPWEINPRTGDERTCPIFRRIGDIKADPDAIDGMIDNKLNYHCLVVRNPVQSYRHHAASRIGNIGAVTSLILDIEDAPPDLSLPVLAAFGIPRPSLAVGSGNGSHVYFFIRPLRPIAGSLAQFEFSQHCLGFLSGLRVDNGCNDIVRCLRLPGTINYGETAAEDRPTYVHSASGEVFSADALFPASRELLTDIERDRDWLHGARPQARLIKPRQRPRGQEGLAISTTSTALRSPALLSASLIPLIPPPCTVSSERRRLALSDENPLTQEYITELTLAVEIAGPGRRNRALAKLVARLRRSHPRLSIHQLRLVHDQWLGYWYSRTSGRHTLDSSFREMLRCWKKMKHQFRTQDEFVQEVMRVLAVHPMASKLGKRSTSARVLANFLYTAIMRSPEKRCHLSTRVAMGIIKRTQKAAHLALRQLVAGGLVEIRQQGTLKGFRATEYGLPEALLAGNAAEGSPAGVTGRH